MAVRNKENYIERAIKSCIHQDFDINRFEIIIINDSSTDQTKNNIIKTVKNFKNCKLFNLKKKFGPGIARNLGLKIAKGKYIIFLDGDDQLNKDALKKISKKTNPNNQIITFNFDRIINKRKIIHNARNDFSKIINNKVKLINNFLAGEIDGSVIFSCFQKKFLKTNYIKFPKGLHEDITFIFKCYIFAKNIIKIRKSLYFKYEVINSITSSISYERINDLLNIHYKLIRILKRESLFKKKMISQAVRGFIGYVADTYKEIKNNKELSIDKKKKMLKIIKQKSLVFPKIKEFHYKSKKDFIFKKFIGSNLK